MKRLNRFVSVIAVVVAGLAVCLPGSANAALSSGNGMKVAPVRTDLVMKPGSLKTLTLYVQNVTNGDERLKVILNDFVASNDESGAPALLLNGETNDQHGLKKFMTAPETVFIPKGKEKAVKVTVTLPKGTPGGGYYGAVRFAPANSSNTNSNVALTGSVGSLVLVKVPGDVVEKLSIVSFDAREAGEARTVFTSGKKIDATVRLRNDGDVQEQPFGKILLKKGSKVIKTIEFNDTTPPGNVLPDSIRRFSIPLKGVGSFGKYTLEGNLGYGTNGQLLSASTTFYVIPIWAILVVVVLILLILFLIFVFPKMVKRYNRNVVRKASRRR